MSTQEHDWNALERRAFLRAAACAGAGALGAGLGLGAAAQNAAEPPVTQPRDISAMLAAIVKKHNLPGMAGAVVDGGRVSMLGAAGVRRLGAEKDPAAAFTPGDLVHLGSCGKAMTATLCGVLVQRGEMAWGRTLAESFPDEAEQMHPVYRAVTLRQLLTHTAGVPNDALERGLLRRLHAHEGTLVEARRMVLRDTLRRQPAHEPGSAYLYSNTGYAIAGHAAETAVGAGRGEAGAKAYEDLMQRHVFGPCGITSAGIGAPGSPGVLDQPRGHTEAGRAVEPEGGRGGRGGGGGRGASDNPPAMSPAGTWHMSVSDWARFVREHLGATGEERAARRLGQQPLLTEATIKELHRPEPVARPPYACGWLVADRPWAGGAALTHAGSNTMWFALAWASPRRDFAMLAVVNHGHQRAMTACDEAVGEMLRERDRDRRGE